MTILMFWLEHFMENKGEMLIKNRPKKFEYSYSIFKYSKNWYFILNLYSEE